MYVPHSKTGASNYRPIFPDLYTLQSPGTYSCIKPCYPPGLPQLAVRSATWLQSEEIMRDPVGTAGGGHVSKSYRGPTD